MITCSCDYDPPEFHSARRVKARKNHKCYECAGIIEVGEVYEYSFGKWEGDTIQNKTCIRCLNIRDWMKINVPCFCWAYGGLHESVAECIDAAYDQARDEVKGLWFGYQRRLYGLQKYNQQKRKEKAALSDQEAKGATP
jgi:uncharacterized Fe-S center protein